MLKRILPFLFVVTFLTACPSSLPPAQQSDKPMEKADAIYVYTGDSIEVLYKKTAQALFDKGYTIETSDPSLMIIKTEYKEERNAGMKFYMRIKISVRENSPGSSHVKIEGEWTRGGGTPQKLQNVNMFSDVRTEGWKILSGVASSIGGSVRYSRGI